MLLPSKRILTFNSGLSVFTAGGGAAFSPDSVSGLKLWVMADVETFQDIAMTTPATLNGHQVNGWKDQSGENNHMIADSAGGQPVLNTSVQNGLPSVNFISSGRRLTAQNNIRVGVGAIQVYIVSQARVVGDGASAYARICGSWDGGVPDDNVAPN